MSHARLPLLSRIVLLCGLVLVVILPVQAQTVVRLRMESLDGVLADLGTVSRAAGTELPPDAALAMLAANLGVPDLGMVDRGRPVVVAFPVEGLMLGMRGAVAALPVSDPAAAIEALEGRFEHHEQQGEVHVFGDVGGPSLHVATRDDYLLATGVPELLASFDLGQALARGDLPPGNLSADVLLDPLQPMVQMGLAAAQQQLAAAGQEPDSGEEPALDPEVVTSMLAWYGNVLGDLFANVERLQLAVQVGDDHLLLRKRLVPKPGSTLADLVAAQTGGLPDAARLLDPGAPVVVAGQFVLTPAFRTAMRAFLQSYFEMMTGVTSGLSESGAAEQARATLELWTGGPDPLLARSVDCMQGDYAAQFDLTPGTGMSVVAVQGHEAGDRCRDLLSDVLRGSGEAMRALSPVSVTVTREAVRHAGLVADRMEWTLTPAAETSDAEAEEAMEALFGGKVLRIYMASTDDLWVSVMGGDAEARFRTLAEQLERNGSGEGLRDDFVAPIETGPGFFGRVDLGALLSRVPAILPADEAEDAAELGTVAARLTGAAGRVAFGLGLDAAGPRATLALPLGLLRILAEEMEEDEEDEATIAPLQGR